MMSLIREFSYFLPVFDQNELKTKIYKIYQKLTEISNIPNITGNWKAFNLSPFWVQVP